ncbi:hypothetical protein HDU99_003668, partial [Rhizoclosmatium hyalinum]
MPMAPQAEANIVNSESQIIAKAIDAINEPESIAEAETVSVELVEENVSSTDLPATESQQAPPKKRGLFASIWGNSPSSSSTKTTMTTITTTTTETKAPVFSISEATTEATTTAITPVLEVVSRDIVLDAPATPNLETIILSSEATVGEQVFVSEVIVNESQPAEVSTITVSELSSRNIVIEALPETNVKEIVALKTSDVITAEGDSVQPALTQIVEDVSVADVAVVSIENVEVKSSKNISEIIVTETSASEKVEKIFEPSASEMVTVSETIITEIQPEYSSGVIVQEASTPAHTDAEQIIVIETVEEPSKTEERATAIVETKETIDQVVTTDTSFPKIDVIEVEASLASITDKVIAPEVIVSEIQPVSTAEVPESKDVVIESTLPNTEVEKVIVIESTGAPEVLTTTEECASTVSQPAIVVIAEDAPVVEVPVADIAVVEIAPIEVEATKEASEVAVAETSDGKVTETITVTERADGAIVTEDITVNETATGVVVVDVIETKTV